MCLHTYIILERIEFVNGTAALRYGDPHFRFSNGQKRFGHYPFFGAAFFAVTFFAATFFGAAFFGGASWSSEARKRS